MNTSPTMTDDTMAVVWRRLESLFTGMLSIPELVGPGLINLVKFLCNFEFHGWIFVDIAVILFHNSIFC